MLAEIENENGGELMSVQYQLFIVDPQGRTVMNPVTSNMPFGNYNSGDAYFLPNNSVFAIQRTSHRLIFQNATDYTVATMLTLGPTPPQFETGHLWPTGEDK